LKLGKGVAGGCFGGNLTLEAFIDEVEECLEGCRWRRWCNMELGEKGNVCLAFFLY
jgi:hypothetical protein